MREILTSWQKAIQQELEAARADLPTLTKAIAEAEAEVAAARRARYGLSDAVSRLGPNATIASSLHWRIRQHEEALLQVSAKLVRTKNDAKSSHARVEDLEAALQQLKQMAGPEEAEAAAA